MAKKEILFTISAVFHTLTEDKTKDAFDKKL
jgi:hypothetical protein